MNIKKKDTTIAGKKVIHKVDNPDDELRKDKTNEDKDKEKDKNNPGPDKDKDKNDPAPDKNKN